LVTPFARYTIKKMEKMITGIWAERIFPVEAQHFMKTRSKIKAINRMTGGARFCTLIVMKDNNREYPPKYNIRKRSTAMARATTLRRTSIVRNSPIFMLAPTAA
jgi:hypothetical protein